MNASYLAVDNLKIAPSLETLALENALYGTRLDQLIASLIRELLDLFHI